MMRRFTRVARERYADLKKKEEEEMHRDTNAMLEKEKEVTGTHHHSTLVHIIHPHVSHILPPCTGPATIPGAYP